MCEPCGELVGPGCCWDAAKEKCYKCAAGGLPVYRCQECDYSSVTDPSNYMFHWSKYKPVEQIHIAEDHEGSKVSRVRNVHFCAGCWSKMFINKPGANAQGEASASSSTDKRPRT